MLLMDGLPGFRATFLHFISQKLPVPLLSISIAESLKRLLPESVRIFRRYDMIRACVQNTSRSFFVFRSRSKHEIFLALCCQVDSVLALGAEKEKSEQLEARVAVLEQEVRQVVGDIPGLVHKLFRG